MQKYIDSHAHLDDEAFDDIRESVLQNLYHDDVELLINCGSNYDSSVNSLNLAKNYDNVYCVLGCHPHDAKDYDQKMQDFLINNANHPKTLAIGEIGLDYHYDLSPRIVQRQVFEKQIVLAHQLNLPIVIHTREAWGDTLEILNANKKYITNGMLLHCFTGSKEVAEILTKNYDAYFSLGGAITFKNFNGWDAIQSIPQNRILTETDCPYMTPVPYRGKTNYPKYVSLVVKKLAEKLETPLGSLVQQIRQNTLRLFNKINLK